MSEQDQAKGDNEVVMTIIGAVAEGVVAETPALFARSFVPAEWAEDGLVQQAQQPAVGTCTHRQVDQVRWAVPDQSQAFLCCGLRGVGSSTSPHNNSLKPAAGIMQLLNARDGRAPAAAYADR